MAHGCGAKPWRRAHQPDRLAGNPHPHPHPSPHPDPRRHPSAHPNPIPNPNPNLIPKPKPKPKPNQVGGVGAHLVPRLTAQLTVAELQVLLTVPEVTATYAEP